MLSLHIFSSFKEKIRNFRYISDLLTFTLPRLSIAIASINGYRRRPKASNANSLPRKPSPAYRHFSIFTHRGNILHHCRARLPTLSVTADAKTLAYASTSPETGRTTRCLNAMLLAQARKGHCCRAESKIERRTKSSARANRAAQNARFGKCWHVLILTGP